jgi:hypothetical protein
MTTLDVVVRNPARLRAAGAPRMNLRQLALVVVAGEIVPPVQGPAPYAIGRDGRARVLPGPGGIVLSHRIGDRCVGLAADHLEPGAPVQCRWRSLAGGRGSANLAFNTLACVGNPALVLDGPCSGKRGVVTGKHGGVDHVLVDFDDPVLRRLRIGDRIQIYAHGLGLRLPDHPELTLHNCSPRLIRRWGLRSQPDRLSVPVSHVLPASVMGSGLGRDHPCRGDLDIQLPGPGMRRRLGLDALRFGDLVAIRGADSRFGRAADAAYTTIGVVVHGDSAKSGHGPGVVTLISGPSRALRTLRDPNANLAPLLRRRPAARPRHAEAGLGERLASGGGRALAPCESCAAGACSCRRRALIF